jgi:hypothetical protein
MAYKRDIVTLLCCILYVLGDTYLLVLWFYAVRRTRQSVFYLLMLWEAIALCFATINAILYYDPWIGFRTLGSVGWASFYYVFVCAQPVNYAGGALALTLLVRSFLKLDPHAGNLRSA